MIARAVAAAPLARVDAHLYWQLAAIPAISAGALAFLSFTLGDTLWTTWLLFTLALTIGPLAFHRLAAALGDDRLQWLGYVALARAVMVVALLYAGWVPQLDRLDPTFGYDAQRYYFEAQELVENGFNPAAMGVSLNYTGILFYYGLLFRIFGHDPVLPAIVNMTVTLAGVLVLIAVGYRVKPQRQPWDWTLGLCLLVPEVLWFDALTARETVAMSLFMFATLTLGTLFLFPASRSDRPLPRGRVVAGAVALAALGGIRTTMLIPAFAALVVMYVLGSGNWRQRLKGAAWIFVAGGILIAGPAVAETIGGYQFGYVGWLRATRSPEYLAQIAGGWTERSLGQLLIPSNLFEEVLFAPIRGLAYLVAPLPRIPLGLVGLAAGSWSDWQYLSTLLSAILYVLLFPVLLVSVYTAIAERKRGWLLIHVPFWAAFAAIAGANIIIMERYRLMMVPLMWAGIWLGWSCDRRLLARAYGCWFSLMALGGIAFAAYKLGF
jgi:hypothetical protein